MMNIPYTKNEARNILDEVKGGVKHRHSMESITAALQFLGDLPPGDFEHLNEGRLSMKEQENESKTAGTV